MKTAFFVAVALALPVACSGDAVAPPDLPTLAKQAVAENPAAARVAISALRAAGPAGLKTLVEANRELLAKGVAYEPKPIVTEGLGRVYKPQRKTTPAWQRLTYALDEVGQQRDNWGSQLYWYTDFNAAKAAAATSKKPILALYLLGKLNEEYSCANSRLFRTALYPNAQIAPYLREHFVLFWKSVRPVPRVTIDFGDGRKIETTITGNSIHYILDAAGRPVDAIPGMYAPAVFLRELKSAEAVALSTEIEREAAIEKYHAARLEDTATSWAADLTKLGLQPPTEPSRALLAMVVPPFSPQVVINPESTDKNNVRFVTLNEMAPALDQPISIPPAFNEEATWKKLAELHTREAKFDDSSVQVMTSKNPTAWAVAPLTASKIAMDRPLLGRMLNFQRTVAEDTVRNEYNFHARIHHQLSRPLGELNDVDKLNEWVYTNLFQTPSADPWLGLLPDGVFTGLPNDGAVAPEAKPVS